MILRLLDISLSEFMSEDHNLPSIQIVNKFGIANQGPSKNKGYMGVSICSHFFSKKNIKAIMEWASDYFSEFIFIIADIPQTYTFMSSKDLSYETALEKSIKIGTERFCSFNHILDTAKYSNIKIFYWKEIINNNKFKKILNKTIACYKNDNNFKTDIIKQIQIRNEGLKEENEFLEINTSQFDLAAIYVLNEISVMIYLQEISSNTFPIQVYPFKMPPALEGLYNNSYCNEIKLNRGKSGYIQIDLN